MTKFTSILIGNESLLIGCGDYLLDEGHDVLAVVAENRDIRDWATVRGLNAFNDVCEIPEAFAEGAFDWLLSIANLRMIPDAVLSLAAKGGVNFHDGPLPRYAGLNTPAWAILNGEEQHGVTWHMMEGGVDEGDILGQRMFDIAADETAFSLNSKCYAAAMESFPGVVGRLASGQLARQPQDLSQRSYFARDARPDYGGLLNFAKPAEQLARFVRAMDFGAYQNPLTCPKVKIKGQLYLVRGAEAESAASTAAAGTVLDVSVQCIRIATAEGILAITDVADMNGSHIGVPDQLEPGECLTLPDAAEIERIDTAIRKSARAETHWSKALETGRPANLPLAEDAKKKPKWDRADVGVSGALSVAKCVAAALALARLSEGQTSAWVGFADDTLAKAADNMSGLMVPWVPVSAANDAKGNQLFGDLTAQISKGGDLGPFTSDLFLRHPELRDIKPPAVSVSVGADAPVDGSVVTLALTDAPQGLALHYDNARLPEAAVDLLVGRLKVILQAVQSVDADGLCLNDLQKLPAAEIELTTKDWNKTAKDFDSSFTIHRAFETQVARTPDAVALVFEGETLSYATLNARANGMAQVLVENGVAPGVHVGLCVSRGPELLIGALAILKAGGAYVPLDPAYPADRLLHYATDSQAAMIIADAGQMDAVPQTSATVINMGDHAGRKADQNVDGGATGQDLAYVIYTSGSTGTPKGVMIEHGNVSNFFTGMDDVVEHRDGSVWLAVTSLAFDISVLELFYTLSRGFKLVLCSDEGRAAVSGGSITASGRPVDFSLYYWSNDCEAGPGKYELLLEGAKFADANGFDALWSPERHFHAFGGPYPNPSVTGAAVAAVTKNLQVRAGSIVAPLHHPARIAEEWAVIDNLTNGGAGLAIASGWHPHDFVLRPENTPPNNKNAMFESIDQIRRLWRGEPVEFPTQSGEMVSVVTQPRPVSKEMPIWVTTAGNPATWREAGEVGANILTHLLGQDIAEVGEKITLYHQALRDNGFDPAERTVTVMLHTLIGEDRDQVREVAKEPLKAYLRSAAGLIKQFAWAFPAFKRPKGVKNPFELDLEILDPEELEAILDFAFDRYFNESGLFGTVEDGIARVEELKKIGVGEVACLIDYGIPNAVVLDSLPYLADMRARSNQPAALAQDDYSIAAQIIRHDVTHMQCTPSLARMLTMNEEACLAMGRLQHLYVGGEALPGSLVEALRHSTQAQITNMYGPTETTIWSSTFNVAGNAKTGGTMPIGEPVANTSVYVLDRAGKPTPVGVAGELYIGGAGVARGYWQREELTAERFVPDTHSADTQARMYRTGDLVCWRPDGILEFVGRVDHQVKIRGQRIEPGEIESCLGAHPSVKEAVVVARPTGAGNMQLAAYLTADDPVAVASLRSHVSARLPEVMVPVHFVVLDAFPLTPNLKIDRNALPEPTMPGVRQDSRQPATASGTKTEAAIADLWTRILGVSGIRRSDSFFDLGGHSLLAVQAHRELRTELELPQLSVTDIFRFPKLSALAAHVEKLCGDAADTAETVAKAAEVEKLVNAETMSKRRAMRAARNRRAI